MKCATYAQIHMSPWRQTVVLAGIKRQTLTLKKFLRILSLFHVQFYWRVEGQPSLASARLWATEFRECGGHPSLRTSSAFKKRDFFLQKRSKSYFFLLQSCCYFSKNPLSFPQIFFFIYRFKIFWKYFQKKENILKIRKNS